MSVILLILSLLIAGAGGVAIGFGIVINTLPIGDTLLISGSVGFVGGILLLGIATAVSQLSQIAEAVKSGRALVRGPDAQQSVATALETALQDTKSSEPKGFDSKALERALESKGLESKGLELNGLDLRGDEPKSVESRPVEARPAPADSRPYAPPRAEPQFRPQAPVQEPAADLSSSAIERLRSTMVRPDVRDRPVISEDVPLSPNGNGHSGPIEPLVEPRLHDPRMAEPRLSDPRLGDPRLDPRLTDSRFTDPRLSDPRSADPRYAEPRIPEPRPASRASDGLRGKPAEVAAGQESRLDYMLRSRETPPAPAESFDSMWPKRGGRQARIEPARVEPARVDAGPRPEVGSRAAFGGAAVAEARRGAAPQAAAPAPAVAAPAADETRSVAILKSGVVDGMAYTLYADGSIEAQLPQGTVRFGSIAELRAHIENHS
jgi:hypothetical protein